MKKVLLADDHPIFREGLRKIIEGEEGYEVIAEAGDGDACITSLEFSKPDVVILDLAMPNTDGYGVLEWLQKKNSNIVAIVISMHSSRAYAAKAKALGARAFVAKEDAGEELHSALMTPKGVFYLSASVGGGGLNTGKPMTSVTGNGVDVGNLKNLTTAERTIFEMVGQSLTSRQIGKKLNISYRTVQTHRQRINQKLDLRGPNSLLQFALGMQTSRKV